MLQRLVAPGGAPGAAACARHVAVTRAVRAGVRAGRVPCNALDGGNGSVSGAGNGSRAPGQPMTDDTPVYEPVAGGRDALSPTPLLPPLAGPAAAPLLPDDAAPLPLPLPPPPPPPPDAWVQAQRDRFGGAPRRGGPPYGAGAAGGSGSSALPGSAGAAPRSKRLPAAIAAAAVARSAPPGGQAPGRPRDRRVLLPGDNVTDSFEEDEAAAAAAAAAAGVELGPGGGADVSAVEGASGRVVNYCVGDALVRPLLEQQLQQAYPHSYLTRYPDALHVEIAAATPSGFSSHIFFFDSGVVCTWGLSKQDERAAAAVAAGCAEGRVPPARMEVDKFEFRVAYSARVQPSIANDVITINWRQAADAQVKLAICHALAQSTKLSYHEERVADLVDRTKSLPALLADKGEVPMSAKEVAKLTGQVFLLRSTVNLLSGALDTPEYFWSAPDAMQVLYEAACEYLQLEARVEVLNARMEILQELLDMLRATAEHKHGATLEIIIIALISVELALGLLQIAGMVQVH